MLTRKMLRELKLYLSQFITIFLMVFIGVMVYSGIEAYMTGMQVVGDNFYEENNLQDLNVMGYNFTSKDLDKIKELDNVKDAERKLTLNAIRTDDDVLKLSFIESNNISKFYIVDGEKFNKNKEGIWLDNFYAEANNLKVGSVIKFKYDGYTFEEKVLGLINVPDRVYEVKDESEMFADHEKFGFGYLSINEMNKYIKYKTMKDMNINEDTFNKLNLKYEDHYVFSNIMVDVDKKDNVNKVKSKIEETLNKDVAVMKIEDSFSYMMYQSEIEEGETYVGIFSGLFIFIAMLSVVTTMTRIVKNQRIQIGTLKALGFSNLKIINHYISYALIVSLVASICGLLGGYYFIGNLFINIEMNYFQVPNGIPMMAKSSYICALLVVLLVIIVTYLACRKSLKEQPANILRNEIPKVKGKSLNITTKGIFKKLSFSIKWNIRDMLRNKIRTITGIAGIAGCCLLIVCAFGILDSMNNFLRIQFDDLYNFKYKLILDKDIKEKELINLKNKYGNSTSKSYLIEIENKDNELISNNLFIDATNNKVRYLNDNKKFIKLKDNGVYITYKLAEQENYKIGDTIKWHFTGNNKYYEAKIIGFNKDPQNQNMTMTKEYLEDLGIKYNPDSLYTDNNLKGVKEIENVDLIQNPDNLKSNMDQMLTTMKSMVILLIFVAVILGIVIIYNMGILSYTEKKYQFATLKVLGFEDKKIKKIFITQNNIIAIISIIIGLPSGYLLLDWLFVNSMGDKFDFRAFIELPSYIYAIIGTFLVTYIVSKIIARKIKDIDMVSSLKGNE